MLYFEFELEFTAPPMVEMAINRIWTHADTEHQNGFWGYYSYADTVTAHGFWGNLVSDHAEISWYWASWIACGTVHI